VRATWLVQRFDFEGLLRELDEREPEDRFATVPDFFVEEVRLVAAAARFGADLDALRDFEAEDLAPPRLELRDAELLDAERDAPERDEDERDEDFRAVEPVDFAEVFLAVVFFAVLFLAADFFAVDLLPDFAEDFEADLVEVFLAAVFLAVVFFAPDFAEDFEADFEVDFAAVFFVPELFLAPELFEPDFLALEELLRELLFFAVFLVLVAPVSPVNSIVSGFLVSVGIAASFKGLRVQPSRLQGNVVIPTRFRIPESVDSRMRTFSVDILSAPSLSTCR